MKKIALWSLGALIALAIFLISGLPAAQVLYRIALPNSISINGVSGTVWNGQAQQVVIDGIPVDDLKWSLSPWSLILGKVYADIDGGNMRDTDAVAVQGPVTLSLFNFSSIQTEEFTLYLPTNSIIAKAKLPIRVNMGGRFKISIQTLDFASGCNELQGKGEWLNASVVLPQGNSSLGSFSADLSCNEKDIQMQVEEPNVLGLSFVSVVSPDLKRFNVEGKFKVDDSLPRDIHSAARFFGSPEADGYTRISL